MGCDVLQCARSFPASEIPGFAEYLLVIEAPQLIVLAIVPRRSFRHSTAIGGVVSLDAWLILIAWSALHSNDVAGLGWLITSQPRLCLATTGMVLGKAVKHLTNR